MADKVAKTGIAREHGFIYFLRADGVYKTPAKRRAAGEKIEPVKVASPAITREAGYLYFLDADGDVARVPMQRRKA